MYTNAVIYLYKIKNMKTFQDKIAVITGGNSGIGYETAKELKEKRCNGNYHLTLKELLVRIMQSQNLKSLTDDSNAVNHNSLAFVINYIKDNLNEKINFKTLTDKACMSKSTFYRLFKRELGISPNDFILSEKIVKAKQLLNNPTAKIATVSYELGFSDVNYFIRVFKKNVGKTPGHYQQESQQFNFNTHSGV